MFDLILAAMLAQATPAADVSPEPATTAAASPAAPVPITFPRGPRRTPVDVPSLAADDVLIRNSGSTNSAGYALVVHEDGTADVSGTRKTIGEPQVRWLYAKLGEDKPFARLGVARCMKSASFGSFTTITYAGETTTDLSCPGGAAARELMRTIGVIVNQVGIDTRPGIRAMHL